ncbi:hypothetical protein PtA15_6A795 [Puccinia triticina]|uniref:Uncharacterized protein n=1 Tax=Puccinia triticina TaxID=208348 RepID=A0ABY7CML3_9BASI|nr:uncharacterized protein PtA15_6A795 [Puccinia triticina]WAQ86163.1 hypothetical protein PtA15_6A795 [Puccinia triticina]
MFPHTTIAPAPAGPPLTIPPPLLATRLTSKSAKGWSKHLKDSQALYKDSK